MTRSTVLKEFYRPAAYYVSAALGSPESMIIRAFDILNETVAPGLCFLMEFPTPAPTL